MKGKRTLPYEISMGLVKDSEEHLYVAPYVNGELYKDITQMTDDDFNELFRMAMVLAEMMSEEAFRRYPDKKAEYEMLYGEQRLTSLN